jgi:4-amino-4-deoxy-L-arabinose transferase-like glycosyltransferase
MLSRNEQRPTVARLVAVAAVVLYFTGALVYVERFPAVSQDEPWIASSGYQLATAGTLGSDLFAGFHGMERHYFVQMPVYALLESVVFRVSGLGVVQMRALSIVFGLLLLGVVYAVGRDVGGERLGAVAVALMVVQRLTAATEVRPIGILLLDSARLNRYDIAVPVFGLGAFWIAQRASRRSGASLWLLAGVLAGLSALSHLYGAFWLPALLAVVVVRDGWQRATLRPAALLAAGFIAICLPWIAWSAAHWSDYMAQMRTVGARFGVLEPAFYVSNLFRSEGPISVQWLVHTLRELPLKQVGAWTLSIGLPIASVLIARRRRGRGEAESALFVASAVQLLLFVALLQVKSINYVIAVWPLGALMLAWLAINVWDRESIALRALVVILAAAMAIEGGQALVAAAREGRRASSYDWYEHQIADCIPPGSLVLGFQHYWIGLHNFPYRSWLLPLDMTNPAYEAHPVSLDVALSRVGPTIILMDRFARELFDQAADPGHPYHYLATGFAEYRRERSLIPRCVVRDPTYGTMEIYQTRSRSSEATP